jgi:4-hydroxy-2-oxoheptanedioate aldolase
MRPNTAKKRLAAGEATFGTWLSFGSMYATRVLARAGFDWLTVDLEHAPIDWNQAADLFGAIADAGGIPLARVPRGDHDHIKRVLDAGAYGIVVPMVNTVEEARAAIAAAKYPPTGTRSVGGGLHALNFGASPGDYYARANDEILVVLQTESPLGIANAPDIYSLEGVDAIFVGPNDLRANMRSTDGREATDEEFEAALARIIEVGRQTGTPTGMHVMSAAAAQQRAQQGMQFLAIGSDLAFMSQTAQQVIRSVRPEEATADLARY